MRTWLALVVICAGFGLATAEPPEAAVAARVAARWYQAVKRGNVGAALALTAPTVTFAVDTGVVAPFAERAPRGRAALRAAVERWRTRLTEFPTAVRAWSTTASGDDWREVGFATMEESFGELAVRVAHGKVVAIHCYWSWGGV